MFSLILMGFSAVLSAVFISHIYQNKEGLDLHIQLICNDCQMYSN